MYANAWLIGCALCIAGIGNAMATKTSTDTRDLDSSARTSSLSDGAASGGGDALGIAHESASHRANNDSNNSASDEGTERFDRTTTTPAATHQPHLGWQSLLPGSIQ